MKHNKDKLNSILGNYRFIKNIFQQLNSIVGILTTFADGIIKLSQNNTDKKNK